MAITIDTSTEFVAQVQRRLADEQINMTREGILATYSTVILLTPAGVTGH